MDHGYQVNSLLLLLSDWFGGVPIVNDREFLVEDWLLLNDRLDFFVFVIVVCFLRHRKYVNKTSGFFFVFD
jgi:hypothetical protein